MAFFKGDVVLVLAVMTVVVLAVRCSCSDVGDVLSANDEGQSKYGDEAKERMEQARDKAAETEKEPEEASETWTDWAKEKISEGLGFKHDDVKETSHGATDAAEKCKDKVQGVATGTGQYSAEKASDMKNAATEKATGIKNGATEKAAEAAEKAKEVKDKAGGTLEAAKDNIASNYEAAKHKSQKVKDNLVGQARDEEL